MATLDRVYKRDFRVGNGGDYEIIGSENVEDAIKNRFSVFQASIPFIPNYGANLKRYVDEPMNEDLKNDIVNTVTTQILRDERVRLVRAVTLNTQVDGKIEVEVELDLIGNEQNLAINLVV